MKSERTRSAPLIPLLALLPSLAPAAIVFSGHTWQTLANEHRDHPGVFNEYTAVDADTGSIRGVYNSGGAGDSVMTTDITLGTGYTVSYDFYLSNNGNNIPPHNGGTYFGDMTFVFQTSASFGNDNWATDRAISANNHDQFGTGGDTINLSGLLASGIHAVWTFDASDYTVTFTSLADSGVTMTYTRAYWPGIASPSDIHAFRAGLWDSEQTLTIDQFTVVPESATAMLGGFGALLMLRRRRRG